MAKLKAQGTLFKISDGTSPLASSYQTLTQVVSITLPSGSMGIVDTSDLSTTDRTKLPTINDNGQVTIKVQYDPDITNMQGLWTAKRAGTLKYFRISLTDTTTTNVDFAGYVTQFTPEAASVEGLLEASITIEITGSLTIA